MVKNDLRAVGVLFAELDGDPVHPLIRKHEIVFAVAVQVGNGNGDLAAMKYIGRPGGAGQKCAVLKARRVPLVERSKSAIWERVRVMAPRFYANHPVR